MTKNDDSTARPRTTSAAVFHGAGQPLELCELSIPPLEPGELLVEVTLSTICGSDLHTFTGRRSCECPTILGHEIVGQVVESSGSILDLFGNEVRFGDRITWSIAASCGECFFCSNTLPQKCEHLAKYGHEPLGTRGLVGGLAKHCRLMPGTAIIRIPDSLSDAQACPASCCTATAAAALRTAGPVERASVLILGAGSLGLTAAAMALQQRAATVFLADIDDARLTPAAALAGCTAVHEWCPPRNSGSTDAAETGADLLRIGGRLILVGAVFPGRAMELSPEKVVRRLLRIEGVHNYRPEDLRAAIEFLESAPADSPARNLVEREFRLDEVNEAFEFALDHRPLRVSVRP